MFVIAIDGPAGAGKSTIAKRLARELGCAYLDSGGLYRAFTLEALRHGCSLDDPDALAALASDLTFDLGLDGSVRVEGLDVTRAIRGEDVTAGVSTVARFPEVRAVMVSHQRRFAHEHERVVVEGRDMGTVVFPDAAVKVYLDADPGERALRRHAQLGGAEAGGGVAGVRAAMEERDHRDRTREVAPLRRSDDAWVLDTSQMTLDEVFEAVRSRVRSAIRP